MTKSPPNSTREHWIRGGFTLLGVIITAGVTLVAAFIGRATNTIVVTTGPPPTAVETVVVTVPAAPAGANSTDAANPPLPDGVTERRTTGSDPITLRPSYGVDLDDTTSLNWNVGTGCIGLCDGRDVGFQGDGSAVNFVGDYAVVSGPVTYATCARETAYTRGGIERGSLRTGETVCVRTSENRYAVVTIGGASEQAMQLRLTVWDPQIPS